MSSDEKEEAVACEFDMHRVMGLMQHHDAVTGTEKQHVAEDYHFRLASSIGHFAGLFLGADKNGKQSRVKINCFTLSKH